MIIFGDQIEGLSIDPETGLVVPREQSQGDH